MVVTRTYRVWGLTCGACLALVLDGVRSLSGVRSAAVDLVRGGGSRLVITARRALPVPTVRAAVERAGFVLGDTALSRAGEDLPPGAGSANGQPAPTTGGPLAIAVPDAARTGSWSGRADRRADVGVAGVVPAVGAVGHAGPVPSRTGERGLEAT